MMGQSVTDGVVPVLKASGSSRKVIYLNDAVIPEPAVVSSAEFSFPEKVKALHIDTHDSSRGHFRSLSAPEKASKVSTWDFSPRGALNQALKESIQNWRWRMKFKGTEDRKKRVLNNRRAALENDVAQLQTQLEDEKAVRQDLERALGGTDGVQVAVSSLAPQTQKLITEITSLEKEVTHLEQHVLTLYRKVLDQRLPEHRLLLLQGRHSEPSSPCSSHVEEKKHAIAERYGESRFKLEYSLAAPPELSPQQHRRHSPAAAASSHGSKRPHSAISNDPLKTRHGSLLGGTFYSIDEKPREMQNFSAQSPTVSVRATPPRRSLSASTGKPYASPFQVESIPENVVRNFSKSGSSAFKRCDSPFESSSSLDHQDPPILNPNKLSEELVRCMAAIYCKLSDPPLPQLAPFSPSSSTNSSSTTTSSPNEASNGSWSPRWRTDQSANSCEFSCGDQSCKDHGLRDGARSSSMVEVPWICVDKDRLTYAARALRNFRTMVEQLEQVDPGKMSHEQKLAFWINIYNALMMHAYLAYGIPRNRLKRLSLLQKAAYKVGRHSINAQTIEHNILRCRSIRPSQWFQSLLSSPGTKFKTSDERRAYGLHTPEPLVCFALCCGGRCDPAIRVYSAENVRPELESAKLDFLHASVKIRGESKVLLPRILEWYARELAMSPSTLLEMVCQNVPAQLQARICHCIQAKPHKVSAHCLEWIPYSFGFRYTFVQELALRFPPSAQ